MTNLLLGIEIGDLITLVAIYFIVKYNKRRIIMAIAGDDIISMIKSHELMRSTVDEFGMMTDKDRMIGANADKNEIADHWDAFNRNSLNFSEVSIKYYTYEIRSKNETSDY